MNLKIIALIIEACRVIAGDTHQYLSTADEVVQRQVACHGYYAKCLKKKSFEDCMIEREAILSKMLDETTGKAKPNAQ